MQSALGDMPCHLAPEHGLCLLGAGLFDYAPAYPKRASGGLMYKNRELHGAQTPTAMQSNFETYMHMQVHRTAQNGTRFFFF